MTTTDPPRGQRPDGVEAALEALAHKLERGAPATRNTSVQVRVGYDFEPWGRASESWERIYTVTLPTVPYYWQSTSGWVPGAPGLTMKFDGHTLLAAVERASAFVDWWLEHGREMGR